MICTSCNAYYRKSKYNPTDYCDACIDAAEDVEYDSEYAVEINQLLHPSGRTKPVLYDNSN